MRKDRLGNGYDYNIKNSNRSVCCMVFLSVGERQQRKWLEGCSDEDKSSLWNYGVYTKSSGYAGSWK